MRQMSCACTQLGTADLFHLSMSVSRQRSHLALWAQVSRGSFWLLTGKVRPLPVCPTAPSACDVCSLPLWAWSLLLWEGLSMNVVALSSEGVGNRNPALDSIPSIWCRGGLSASLVYPPWVSEKLVIQVWWVFLILASFLWFSLKDEIPLKPSSLMMQPD